MLLVFGTFLPELLPDWPMETIAVWLSLAEGILLVPLLLAVDPVLRLSVRSAYTKNSSDDYPGTAVHQAQLRRLPRYGNTPNTAPTTTQVQRYNTKHKIDHYPGMYTYDDFLVKTAHEHTTFNIVFLFIGALGRVDSEGHFAPTHSI